MHTSANSTSVNERGDYKPRSNNLNHPCIDYSTSSTALDFVRHYVNPAVYIESKISDNDDLVPFKKSPSFECFIAETPRPPRIIKVKRCVCLTNMNSCLVHFEDRSVEVEESSKLTSTLHDTERSETDSGIRRSSSMIEDELHLSIPSLTSMNTAADSKVDIVANNSFVRCTNRIGSSRASNAESDAAKEQRYLEWCAQKDTERHLLKQKECLLQQIKEQQRKMQLEKERDNFKKWLAIKKLEEQEKQRQIEEIVRKEREEKESKHKRIEESKLTYQIWLKRKEEKTLEKKIQKQFLMLKAAEEKQKRDEYNRKAYERWLVQSINKPRPIPSNQGLQSLKSSASLTYFNPKPWVPNVDIKPKPASQ